MKIMSIVGARPNFMKIAPIARAIKNHPSNIKHLLVHTGQHYDHKMSGSFFDELGIQKPDIDLEVGSASHAVQTATIMIAFEQVLLKHKPDVVLVVGDVNSTLACSVVAAKLQIPVVHVEAGLRSYDRTMPEEINRLVTDVVSDMFFTTCMEGNDHLISEGTPKNRIFFVGNVMIDTLLFNKEKASKSTLLTAAGVNKGEYALVTLHRPSNVDDPIKLKNILKAIDHVQKKIKVIWPIHPRTKKNIQSFKLEAQLKSMSNLILMEPLGYFDFMCATMNAKLVMTDSGGIQEETTVLKVPCLTIRENTERPITITEGSNVLVGTSTAKIIKEADQILKGKVKKYRIPKYWDGKASERIVSRLVALHKKKGLLRK